MQNLKIKNNWNLFFIFLLLTGCSTSRYKVLKAGNYGGIELNLTPDRIVLECEWLHDASEPGLYGFMMHILDEENTVFTIAQGNTLGKKGCEERLKKIGHILKEGKYIYIVTSGDLSEPRQKGKVYLFPKLGTFYSNERSLAFISITNELGTCYDSQSGDRPPCPREPFNARFE